jgi:hypothetical protein
MAPDQFFFIQGLPFGRSRRDYELQQSEARSHAALIAHQRLRSKTSSKDDGLSVKPPVPRLGQMNVPFHTLRQLPKPPSLGDESDEISVVKSSPTTVSSSQDSISPPLPADTVENYPIQEQADGRHAKPTKGRYKYTTNISLKTASFPQSYHKMSPPFKISLSHEGFQGLRTDPFFCIPSSRDHRVGSTLDFYSQVLNPGNDTVCYIFNVTNVYASFLETIQDEYFFDAGVGLIQFLQEQLRDPGSEPSVHTLKHKGNAIAKLRDRLSESNRNVDDVTIFAMIFLAVLDRGLRNSAAYDLHKRNIAMMISQRGGLKSLRDGSLLKTYLLHYDTFWAMESGETIYPGERRRYKPAYPTDPFSTELYAMITRLPPRLQTLVTEGVLSLNILPLLCRATLLARLSTRGRFELLSKSRRSTKLYDDFWEACPCLCVSDDSCTMLEKLLSLTLVCYSFLAFGSRSYPTALRGSRFEITKIIGSYSPQSQTEEECLIWMWIVIIDSWRLGRRLQPSGISLLFNLQLRFPALRQVSAVTDVANRFIWTDDLNKSVYVYWDDLISPV